jgi:hypothetical protein
MEQLAKLMPTVPPDVAAELLAKTRKSRHKLQALLVHDKEKHPT